MAEDWEEALLAYEPAFREIAKPGTKVKVAPHDYGYAMGLSVEMKGKRVAGYVRKFVGVPRKNWFMRLLQAARLLRPRSRYLPAREAAAHLARWLRGSEFGQPQSVTGSFDWEYIEGVEPTHH